MLDNPPTPQEKADAEHLKLISIFHYVVSGLAAFFACFPIIHLVVGLFMIFAPQKFGPGNNQPPAEPGWLVDGAWATFFRVFGVRRGTGKLNLVNCKTK